MQNENNLVTRHFCACLDLVFFHNFWKAYIRLQWQNATWYWSCCTYSKVQKCKAEILYSKSWFWLKTPISFFFFPFLSLSFFFLFLSLLPFLPWR